MVSGATASPGGDGLFNVALAALGVAFAVAAALAGAGWATGQLSGHDVPFDVSAGIQVVFHPGDLPVAFGGEVGPAWLFWAVVVLLAAALVGVGWLVWRFVRDEVFGAGGRPKNPAHWPGMAGRREVSSAAGPRPLLGRAGSLRPSISKPVPRDVGYRLGYSRGVACWASVEDSMVLLGPPRSGKGLHEVISMILDAPGAVVTTSTRPDNLAATIDARSTGGRPVSVFDPQRLARGIDATTKWSPIRGCEDPQTAMTRARALCADDGKGVENGSFWAQQCYTVVRCLLHAAAIGRRSTLELYQWSLSANSAKDAVDILRSNSSAAPAWSQALASIVNADARQRDSTWAMVANTFAALADPAVLEALSPRDWEHFDPYTFLRQRGALYLLGTASGASATAGLVAAFVEDVVEAARRLAAASPGARLDAPVALVLDEAANYPLPSLPSLMSEGGGTGITTVVVLQSLAQARSQWGKDAAESIWDSAIVKIILGGSGNAGDLRDLSALIGTRRDRRRSVSYGGGGRSYSDVLEDKPILDPGDLRVLPFGYAVLLLRSAEPIMMRLVKWPDRSDGKQLSAARAAREQQLLAAAATV